MPDHDQADVDERALADHITGLNHAVADYLDHLADHLDDGHAGDHHLLARRFLDVIERLHHHAGAVILDVHNARLRAGSDDHAGHSASTGDRDPATVGTSSEILSETVDN